MSSIFKIFFFTYFLLSFNQALARDLEFDSPHGGSFKYKTLINGRTKLVDTASLHGYKVLLFFGFTNCKSVCPMTLSTLKSLMSKLPAHEQERTKVLFISVDTERDKLEEIARYIKIFDPKFLFGSESDSQLKKILKLYGARYYKIKTDSNKILIDHTSDVFLINEQGQWTHTMPFTLSDDEFYKIVKGTDATIMKQYQNQSTEILNSKVISDKKSFGCLLNSQKCKLSYQDNNFELKLNADKIISQKKNSVIVTTDIKNRLTPYAVDFSAKETYMGHIRPGFVKVNATEYKAEFEIPSCELQKMNWEVAVIFKDNKNNFFTQKFKMKSYENE